MNENRMVQIWTTNKVSHIDAVILSGKPFLFASLATINNKIINLFQWNENLILKNRILCVRIRVFILMKFYLFSIGTICFCIKKYFARWSILEGFGEITNNIMNLRIEARDNDVITFYSFNSNWTWGKKGLSVTVACYSRILF